MVETAATMDDARLAEGGSGELEELLRAGSPAFVQTGKLTALGELAGGVAHEINNPLFAILGLVEFLLREVDEGTKAHQRLLLVQETGLEIKEIVRAMLAFAREQSGERTVVSLDDVVADALDLVRRTNAAKGLEVVERLHGEALDVVASPNELKQVVLHLVANARQAMPDGGTVTVGVATGPEHATVTVADEGPGVPEGSREQIFEPFVTTRADGTGLGLAVSRAIARRHGGDLGLEAGGPGARFVLRLPLADR
jgi:two-component system NtrC family sensor kinase